MRGEPNQFNPFNARHLHQCRHGVNFCGFARSRSDRLAVRNGIGGGQGPGLVSWREFGNARRRGRGDRPWLILSTRHGCLRFHVWNRIWSVQFRRFIPRRALDNTWRIHGDLNGGGHYAWRLFRGPNYFVLGVRGRRRSDGWECGRMRGHGNTGPFQCWILDPGGELRGGRGFRPPWVNFGFPIDNRSGPLDSHCGAINVQGRRRRIMWRQTYHRRGCRDRRRDRCRNDRYANAAQ